ncbi:universal stress protein [Hymenobacter convexus]|uniref:universal stress protein n=1 Tax=Hymenobacter sp. CA1UV-4 TaxID=3063782 RepID=UPI002713231E|nr:universal stress protein [Hymenobacter sp. CA1UV-4]MDO7852446.1 universal stress protein [Hymenobacter sp. CA1UV-4]
MSASLVVLTDFFAVSNRALSYAAGLAVPLNAHLVLLHVCHDGLLAPAEYHAGHTRAGAQHTRHALEKLAANQPVPAEVDITEEFLPEAVQEVVRRHQPLLLVLGRPGLAHAPEEIIVSTAMDLLRQAPHPLLVVPTVGWDAFPPRRLLLAVDGEPFHLYPHQGVVQRLLQATDGTLDVVHIAAEDSARPDAVAILDRLLKNNIVDELPDAGRLHEVRRQHIAGGILEEAARQEADLLVVVARRHSLLGSLFHRSVTAQLIQESPIPVLLLPARD